ncbi:MAG: alpha/beta fold hydrolase [Bacteroidota bacterium]
MKILLSVSISILLIATGCTGQSNENFFEVGELEEVLVDIEGYNMNFHVIEGKGIPIVFESAAGEDGTIWKDILEPIHKKTGATIIAYDRSGFGKSEINPNHTEDLQYGITNGMVELESALKKLGYFDQLILVCSSYGGLYSSLFSSRNPELVKYVVMVDAGLTNWYSDKTVDNIIQNYPITREQHEGHYFLLKNLKETVTVMRESKFPAHIPVIDLVAEIKPSGWDDELWENWESSHQSFTDWNPLREMRKVKGASHYIFQDQPKVVIDAVVEAYQKTEKIVRPILLSKDALSGIGLEQLTLDDQPNRAFFQRNVFLGIDLSAYIVSSQSWLGKMNNFPIDEYVFMLNGKARLKPENQENSIAFQSNEHFFAPKGYTGEWEIMAGNNYHYELSVITTNRADTVMKSRNLRPFKFDADVLSGIGIDFSDGNLYENVLVEGDELTVSLIAEKTHERVITEPIEEQIIHLISGMLILTSSDEETYFFHTGDFFILPKGFTGLWESDGNALVKYLRIEKTKK